MTLSRALVVAALACGSAPLLAQNPREAPAEATGTATLRGQVVTADADARPVRLARVSLSLVTGAGHLPMVIADNEGRFVFSHLPAGRFSVAVEKAGFVQSSYGAKRPQSTGIPIVLADGEAADIVVRIARGAVVSGTVLGPGGAPAVGVQMSLLTLDYNQMGQKGLVQVTFGNSSMGALLTDDRGAYRVYGLRAGDYYIVARPFVNGLSGQIMSSAELDWAQRLLTSPSIAAADPPPTQSVTLAPVLYPGTIDPSAAVPVTVGAGEERTGVDFTLDYVPTAHVSGIVHDPDGLPPKVAQLSLLQPKTLGFGRPAGNLFIRPEADGHFSTGGILPGDYVLAARGSGHNADAGPGAGPNGGDLPYLSLTELHVAGHDIDNLDVTLAPGANLSGRLAFEGTTPPPDLTKVNVSLGPALVTGSTAMGASPTVAGTDGRFTLRGIGPGEYLLFASVPGPGSEPAWTLKSAIVHGVDAIDVPIEIGRDDVADAVITFTDRPTELTGALRDAAGKPAPEYFILVASTDRTSWTPQSRRIKSARPATNGNFRVTGFPPGEYYVLAVTDLDRNRMFSAEYLEPLVGSAMKMTFTEGEKKVQDFKISAGGEATARPPR
jgi:hypothetical protein